MEKLAHSFGLRRSTRSFAKLSSNPSPQPPAPTQPSSRVSNKENMCRQSMGPPPVGGGGKSHMPASNGGDCDPNGSKRAMLSTSSCGVDKNNSQVSTSSSSSSKKSGASWDRRLSVGIKRTISKLKLNSKSNKSNYLPVVDYPESEPPPSLTTSVSSIPMATSRCKGSNTSSYDAGHAALYRNGIGASLDQLNTLGAGGGRFYENQGLNYQAMEPPVNQPQPRRNQQQAQASNSNNGGGQQNSGAVIGAPSASPYIARAPRMGTSALRYSRDPATNNSRPSRLDQSFNAMLPVAEEQQDTVVGPLDNANGTGATDNNGGFLWKAGWLSRYNLRSSRSRLNMSYNDDPIVAGGGVDDSYMAEDLDDTRTGDAFNVSLVYSSNNQ